MDRKEIDGAESARGRWVGQLAGRPIDHPSTIDHRQLSILILKKLICDSATEKLKEMKEREIKLSIARRMFLRRQLFWQGRAAFFR
jgi:hypothetical protein